MVVLSAEVSHAQSANLYLAEILKLNKTMQKLPQEDRGEIAFKMHQLVKELLAEYPASSVSLKIKADRIPGIKVSDLKELANDWASKNPTELQSADDGNGNRVEHEPSTRLEDKEPNVPIAKVALPIKIPTLSLPKNLSAKPDVSQASKMIGEAAVLVVVGQSSEKGFKVNGFGSGYFINNRQIVTNSHVLTIGLKGNSKPDILIFHKKFIVDRASIVANGRTSTGRGLDIAVLETEQSRGSAFLRFASEVRIGETITTGGFPAPVVKQSYEYSILKEILEEGNTVLRRYVPNPSFGFGRVQGISNTNSHTEIQVGVETSTGSSGSPVTNACGDVIGLHFKSSTGSDNSKFNFALSYEDVVRFLADARIEHSLTTALCGRG